MRWHAAWHGVVPVWGTNLLPVHVQIMSACFNVFPCDSKWFHVVFQFCWKKGWKRAVWSVLFVSSMFMYFFMHWIKYENSFESMYIEVFYKWILILFSCFLVFKVVWSFQVFWSVSKWFEVSWSALKHPHEFISNFVKVLWSVSKCIKCLKVFQCAGVLKRLEKS
jgi:hypothetical protein